MRHSKNRRRPTAAFLVRMLLAGMLAMLLPLQAIASPIADDIVIVAFKGDVQVTSGGTTQGARAGSTLDLPAMLRTGRDGSIDLRQGDTTIGVGPDTQLDFPAQATSADAIDRVVQPSGNAYYSVGPRGKNRLRVETPYLVAVIKGTQFNVAVTPDSSTISLHEGRLQVLATEAGIAAVELNAGEVAIRRSGEKTIRVLQVKNGAASAGASAGNSNDGASGDASPLANDVDEVFGTGDPGGPTNPAGGGVTVDVDGSIDELGGVPVGADVGVDTSVDLGAASIDASVGAGVELGAGTVDASVDAALDLGAASVDSGVDAGIDLGAGTVDAVVDAGVDLGAAGVDAAADAGVDLGAGTVDAGVDAGIDLGAGVEVDLGADAAVDAGAGTIDAGVAADVAGVDAGVDLGIDLTGSDAGIDVGIDLPGTGIDLGLGGNTPGDGGTDAPASDDSGGLLGGLLGRPRP